VNAYNFCKLAILLLDDEHGINESAWRELENELHLVAKEKPGSFARRILEGVRGQDDRYFMPAELAAKFRISMGI